MKKEALYRWLTIVTPLVAIVGTAGVSIFEWQRLKRFEAETTTAQGKLVQIGMELRSFEATPQTEKYPTVAKSPREQGLFLDALRANADATKVQLIRWSNTTPAPAASTGDKNPAALPAGVSAIISIVEVSGRSENTRQFLYNVIRSRRLLNMTDIHWVRDTWPNTHLTFILTRYVAPPVQLPDGRPQPERPDGNRRDTPSAERSDAASHSSPAAARQSPTAEPPGRMVLPNPMDAPGIAHGSYQSGLEAGVSKLSELDRTQPSASPRPPAVTNGKR